MNKVIWTQPAKDSYSDILSYLVKVAAIEAESLTEKVENITKQLEVFGKLCPVSPKNNKHHRCVITKNYSIVYRIRNNKIYILAFADNRSKPVH